MQTKILIGLFICHWLADYTHLSTSWMLHAKRIGKPLFPIFIHANVHGLLMLLFMLIVRVDPMVALKLWTFQVITHFLIDTWKGKMNVWFPSLESPANKWYWVIFGFDQLLHALVIVGMSSYAV